MSGPLAIAATSATLRDVLQSGMTALGINDALGEDVTITVAAPDRVVREGNDAKTQLNVFLYNVVRNIGYANNTLPARDSRGERTANPVLALDLHYLLTAYGVEDYHAEILLGGAVQVLHETPALGREAIRDALAAGPMHPNLPEELQGAGLADQFEYLKISPLPMPSEEISRLWTSFQVPYRPSVGYLVSVVLIESRRSTRSTLPVRERAIHVVPFRELRVTRVVSSIGINAPITVNSTLRIVGRQLGAPNIRVFVNAIDVTAGVVSRSSDEIRLTLPGPPAGLHPGLCGVQLVQPKDMGGPPAPHEGFLSNVASFVLVPQIVAAVAPNRIDITSTPPVGAQQRVRLLLNQSDAAPAAVPRAYSFHAPAGNGVVPPATETNVISFALANVTPGNYLVRLEVDGAQSPLIVGAGGRFEQPEVVL